MEESQKFYTVLYWQDGASNPTVIQKHVGELEKAITVAKKTAVEWRSDAYVMTATHLVQAPAPAATVTELK